ncbi:MAG: T9SS type A sorting domain-containing protein, partial [Calditrichaeota bacterium]|nr:T9SS type A sorting domain-containing protein [Calditrichota bacterium]
DGENGLVILNVADLENPTEVGHFDTDGIVNDIKINGNHAYIAAGSEGLIILDVSDSESPSVLGSLDTPGDAADISVWDNNIFLADGNCGMRIISISDPQNPTEVDAYDTPGKSNSLLIENNQAYLCDGENGVVILDVSEYRSPVQLPTSLFAENCIHIQPGTSIESGDVWVNTEDGGRFFEDEVEIYASPRVNFAETVNVKANFIRLMPNSTIEGNLTCNELEGRGEVIGENNSPLEQLPIILQECMPYFPEFEEGDNEIRVRSRTELELQEGLYRSLTIGSRSTVYLTGGSYVFDSIEMQNRSRLVFNGPTEIRIKNKMNTASDVVICPDQDSDLSAADLIVYVEGVNGRDGSISENPKAVSIGSDNNCSANIYAQNGTVQVGNRTEFEGSVISKDIWLGSNVEITFNGVFYLQDFDGDLADGNEGINLSNQVPVPDEFTVEVYPNPFNSMLTLAYGLPEAGLVQAKIFDIQGRLVNELLNRSETAGYHKIIWAANQQPTGIYILSVKTGSGSLLRKISLIK